MADYDLKAMFSAIEQETGSKLVTYLGYGQGALLMLYALTLNEKTFYKDRLNQFVALAPCLYIESGFQSKIQLLDAFKQAEEDDVYWTTKPIGNYAEEIPDG